MSQRTPQPENLAKLVFLVRGEKVLLDTDLADLYGLEARVLNQSVARNRNRFPDDFMFQLTTEEWTAMRSKIVTSAPSNTALTSQIVMSNMRGGRRTLPYAFTEQGVAMQSSIEAMETRYDEQFAQVFDAIKQLITEDKARKAKPPIGFL